MEEINRFKQSLLEKETPQEKIEEAVSILTSFNNFLLNKNKNMQNATSNDFYDFSMNLIKDKRNTGFAYEVFIRFGFFIDNKNLILWGREVLDGSEVMHNFSKRLKEEFSEEFRNEIFEGMDLPPLGISPKEKPEYTKKLVNRFVEKTDEQTCEIFLAKGLRDSYYEWRKPDRERFLNSKNIDEFMEEKRKRQIEGLEKHRDEGTLYFTQEINNDVVEHVKNDPRIETGIRKGEVIIATKIPHETIKFLKETDPKMKAYFYCHCPWVKEAIKDGTVDEIPNVFCNCSGGYYKSYWEIVLDQPIDVKTVKTVINGDPVCEFEIYLPENIVEDLN
jgi:hypothetical protein